MGTPAILYHFKVYDGSVVVAVKAIAESPLQYSTGEVIVGRTGPFTAVTVIYTLGLSQPVVLLI